MDSGRANRGGHTSSTELWFPHEAEHGRTQTEAPGEAARTARAVTLPSLPAQPRSARPRLLIHTHKQIKTNTGNPETRHGREGGASAGEPGGSQLPHCGSPRPERTAGQLQGRARLSGPERQRGRSRAPHQAGPVWAWSGLLAARGQGLQPPPRRPTVAAPGPPRAARPRAGPGSPPAPATSGCTRPGAAALDRRSRPDGPK